MKWPWQRGVEERRYTLTELRSLSFQDVFGQGLDFESINGTSMERTVGLVPVYACTRLIAEMIAAMPLEQYRKVAGEQVPMELAPIFTEPSQFAGPFEWVQRSLLSKLLKGNSYGMITQFDYAGWPRQMEWLHPDEVTLLNNSTTQILLFYGGRIDWRLLGQHIEPWAPRGMGLPGRLVHIPWYTLPGFVKGLSPIGAFRTTIESGQFAQQYGRDWFRSGGNAKATLESEQPINEQQANEVKARFKAAASGNDVVAMGAGLKYNRITVPPDEAQFLATIKANATQIASIYGLPASRAGGEHGTHRTYANVEQESQDLVNALVPYLTKLEQAFSNLLPRGQYVRFKIDSQVRADMAARYAAYQIALGGPMGAGRPFMTPDEVRRIEGMEPMEEEVQEPQQPQLPSPQIVPLPAARIGGSSGS